MASSVRRRRRNAAQSHSSRLNFPQKQHKFFKIIVNPQAHRLKIPTDFTRRYGLHLPNRVCLRAPSGPPFEVKLIESNGEKWMQKGWNEFQEYYSVDFGHFLVFEYDGVSSFHVLIFDTSASEIQYPSHSDTESESDEESSTDKKRKCKILSEDDETEDDVSDQVSGSPRKRKITRVTALDRETNITYQRAKAFKSHNPNQNPHFISLMQPSYVSSMYTLAIPATFVRENFRNRSNHIQLQVCDGKLWRAKCCVHGPNGRINCGWKRFAEDNGLKVGDACVFEVSGTNKFVLNVTIFRG